MGFHIRATDGELGKVRDLYFDDRAWTVRYIVVDTGGWLPGRQVLISPVEVSEPDWDEHLLPVNLTREQVEMSPGIQEDQPVSRQHEQQLAGYYGWEPYWGPVGLTYGVDQPTSPSQAEAEQAVEHRGDPDLRSAREVRGYDIHATDGEIGHVEDFLLDPDGWVLRYLVVDTRKWLPGKDVLLAPHWAEEIDWSRREVVVGVRREQIKSAPEFSSADQVDRDYEHRLHEHYGRDGYWT